VNKSNKIGVTEAVLRDMMHKGVATDCVGYQMLLGSSEERLARENLSRLIDLFENSPSEELQSLIAKKTHRV
jgi:hypothetical protein